MTIKTLSRWQKAVVLVPLAVASGAWTATLAAPGGSSTDSLEAVSANAASSGAAGALPDGTTMPTQAIEAPASVSSPGTFGSGGYDGSLAQRITDDSSLNGIPSAAIAAYQRAAQVINSADKACNLGWELPAAIGRVESDHGTYGGSKLTAKGVSQPGILGIPLDGSKGTARISDTDGGEFDDDDVWDRAMGPMQFIPSTWSIVGVDSDGDGDRNPQDVDDAALATAVYLCSGNEDLSSDKGQRTSIFRYNRSDEYVDLVIAIMKAYEAGNFTTTPNDVFAGTTFFPSPEDSVITKGTKGSPKSANNVPAPPPDPITGGSFTGSGGSSGFIPGSGTTTSGGGGGGVVGDATGTVSGAAGSAGQTVQDTLTPLERATNYCRSQNLSGSSLSACTEAYLSGGSSAVSNLLSGGGSTVGGATGGAGGAVGGAVGGLGG